MCNCGNGQIVITNTFIIENGNLDLEVLDVNDKITATRKSTAPVSGKNYYYGGHYQIVLALPEDVVWLLTLIVKGVQVFTESEE